MTKHKNCIFNELLHCDVQLDLVGGIKRKKNSGGKTLTRMGGHR